MRRTGTDNGTSLIFSERNGGKSVMPPFYASLNSVNRQTTEHEIQSTPTP